MKKHRITEVDIYGSLRAAGIWNVCEIEAVILGELNRLLVGKRLTGSPCSEPTGVFSIYRAKDLPTDYVSYSLLQIWFRLITLKEPDVLNSIKGEPDGVAI